MKHLLKIFVFWLAYVFHRNNNSKIFYYHDVNNKYTQMGTSLDTIKRHFKIVTEYGYEIVKEITQQKNQIMICFDDGWSGIYDAKDFFLENKIFPTIFVVVDLIGTPGHLSLSQIKELQDEGFVFEGHTWSHKDLTKFNTGELQHEIMDSKEELSRLLGKKIEAISFPKGHFSDKVYQCCIAAGYTKLYTSIPGGYYDLLMSRNLICRNMVQKMTDKELKYVLNSTSGFYVRKLIKQNYIASS